MAGAAATVSLSSAAQDATEAQVQRATPTLLPTTTATGVPTSTPPMRQLSRLYVDGPYVKRTDTKAPVWLKGLNVEEFRQRNPHTFNDLYNVQGLAIVMEREWGINLLRVAVDPESVEATTSEFDTLIGFAQEHGMYVILTPFASAINPPRDDERLPVPDELVATAMGYLAAKFKNRTNVLFGLWNEPHPDSIPTINYDKQWQTWMDAGIKVANAIRRNDPQSILVVPGGNKWARDMTYYQDRPFPFDNVIYDVHDYWAYPDYHYTRAMWTWAIARYPILIGEFGGDPTNPSDYASINYMQDTFRIVNTNSGLVHYAVYALTDDPVWGIFTRDLSNTPKGNALRFDLSMYPPTRFR
jgi:hypothetical protein